MSEVDLSQHASPFSTAPISSEMIRFHRARPEVAMPAESREFLLSLARLASHEGPTETTAHQQLIQEV
jgi:hypothetical protein